ncbi:MAG: carbamoyl-phosphate synthase large subunit, partial [Pseudomonadota bacterium]
RRGVGVERLAEATRVDPWFLDQILQVVQERAALAEAGDRSGPGWRGAMDRRRWRRAKRLGFSDAQLAWLWGADETEIRLVRLAAGVAATFATVDTCGAEFEATTPYHYASYEDADEVRPSDRRKVVILGSGPNRIGQGIEFDYCCVHASFALGAAGYETVMVNCNPETVSTDYDTSDRLYFEPLGLEDVLNVIDAEQRSGRLEGVIVTLGGQTPLKLAGRLPAGLVLGTSPESIDRAEDRERWNGLCARLGIPQPAGGTAVDLDQAAAIVADIGYPALVRPSYVLGGRAMQIVYDDAGLAAAMAELAGFGSLGREGGLSAERPVLVDHFLEDAVEVDVDAVRDRVGEVVIGAVMEHVEEAGVHSGDSACVIPPQTLPRAVVEVIEGHTRAIADALEVQGPLNVQFAVQGSQVYVIEANPRASRTVPFVSKATAVPLAKIAARLMVGRKLAEMNLPLVKTNGVAEVAVRDYYAVKSPVFPFDKFRGVDTILGPEMRSTGEVMGVSTSFGQAFAKAQLAAGQRLPRQGTIFLSVNDRDKRHVAALGQELNALGFRLLATRGTAAALQAAGVPAEPVFKVNEGRPNIVDLVKTGKIDLIINTPLGRESFYDEKSIRRAAIRYNIPCITTMSAANAAAQGIRALQEETVEVAALQDLHGRRLRQNSTAAAETAKKG